VADTWRKLSLGLYCPVGIRGKSMLVNDRSLLLILTTADGLTAQCGYIRRRDVKPFIYRPLLRPISAVYWIDSSPAITRNVVEKRCYEFDREHAGAVFYKERLDA
jgi:hypothetical protein